MAQPQNLLPLLEAAMNIPPALVIPPLPAEVAAAFNAVQAAIHNGDVAGVDIGMNELWHAIDHAGAAAAEDNLDYDASTVPVDIDEYYEMNEVFADDLPGSLVNAVQEARPALDLVRAREDVSNRLKNRFYYAMKRLFLLFLGNPVNLDGWRNTYETEMGEVLPHLPAAVIGDLVAPLEAFQETFQPAVDEMLGLRQADGSFTGFPDLHNDLFIYVRRMLRIPEPPPEEEDFQDWPVQEEVVGLLGEIPLPPPGHPQLLQNGGGVLQIDVANLEEVEIIDILPYNEEDAEETP
jgi:hypothetical protein